MRAEIDSVPSSGGVYVVMRSSSEAPSFLALNPAGRFKGHDPTVPAEALRANWVDGAEVVYIGKANQLRRRLRQFADVGAGKPIGDWGGRLVWQLADSQKLLLAWKQTPGRVPREVEARYTVGHISHRRHHVIEARTAQVRVGRPKMSVPEQMLSDARICLARDMLCVCVTEIVRAH
ncbi:MAG TPA: hypothetical protein VN845_09800, partial [Solirubrobacteraceae bacterium]|nr:hypothetical protein [Solirubrobacteraceae bacterium]